METMRRVAFVTTTKTGAGVGHRQVRCIVSTADTDRMGDVIVQTGIDLTSYRRNPVVLWQHDANFPIARAVEIGITGGALTALVQFPDEGTDPTSDRVYALIKAGIVNATSIGFAPKEQAPLDAKQPWGGLKFTKSELLEFSFVSVPANAAALVVGRSQRQSSTPNLDEMNAILARLRADPSYQKYRREKQAAGIDRQVEAEVDREVNKVVAERVKEAVDTRLREITRREADRAELNLLLDAVRADAKKYGIVR